MPLLIERKALRTVLRWQVYATAASMLIAGILMGVNAALSALAGGFINIAAGTVFGVVATRSRKRTAAEAMVAIARAEAAKIALIVALMWLTLSTYRELALAPFFGTFVLTVIFFSMAIFVRDR
ncbi:MAG TPA: ATP synthase subunit I [Burkholderiales bacterium]|nr:ATP synthase subunit I [Burkholderiales bacterium]